jgi:hypothetical protein
MTQFSKLMLERFLCGEGTPQERADIEKAYQDDPVVKADIDGLRTSTADILTTYPAETMAREIELRAHARTVEKRMVAAGEPQARGRGFFMLPAKALVAAAVAVVCTSLVIVHINNSITKDDTVRIKGHHPHLVIYRNLGNGFERLHDRATVSPGDQLQIGYVAADKKFGCIFSVDGNGIITLHYPSGDSSAMPEMRLESSGEHLLTSSFELDSAPRFERFFFVTSERPFNPARVLSDCKPRFARNPDSTCIPAADGSETLTTMSLTLVKEVSR